MSVMEISVLWYYLKVCAACIGGVFVGRAFRPKMNPIVFLRTTMASLVIAIIAVPIIAEDILGDLRYSFILSAFVGLYAIAILKRFDKLIRKVDLEGIVESRLKGD